MLTSVVIEIEALQAGNLMGFSGAAVHGFWLRFIETIDPVLSASLHQAQTQLFTVSPIMGLSLPERGVTPILPGQTAWFRVTSLMGSLSRRMTEEWLPKLPGEFQLAGLEWKKRIVTGDARIHPWAGQMDRQALADQYLISGKPSDAWTFHFETPTAFKIGKTIVLPFPMPGALLGSWLRRWQEFGPVSFDAGLEDRLKNGLAVSEYRLKTVPLRFEKKSEIGCVGDMTLKAVCLSEGERRVVDLLSAFAFWAGSGHGTAQGMGMTRREKDSLHRNGKSSRSSA